MNTVTLFGATFLFSTLPFMVLVSALAGRRFEADLTHHMGLNRQAATVVGQLFEVPSTNSIAAVSVAVVFSAAGAIAMAGSVQQMYEQVFGKARHGPSQILRLILWVALLCGWLVLDAFISTVTRGVDWQPLVYGMAVFVVSTVFFFYSMLVLLAHRGFWRSLILPAAVSALFWMGLQGLASLYFSSTILSDSKLYGPVGVVFSLLVWFTAVGAVIVLGALTGDMWRQRRRDR